MVTPIVNLTPFSYSINVFPFIFFLVLFVQAYQRLQIQQQMMQAQRNVSGPIRQQEQQVSQQSWQWMIRKVMHFMCDYWLKKKTWHNISLLKKYFECHMM